MINTYTAIVKDMLSEADLTTTTRNSTAREIGISFMTMHRYLKDEGTSYSELLKEERLSRLEAMKQAGYVSSSKAHEALGYRNSSGLRHCAESWTGKQWSDQKP